MKKFAPSGLAVIALLITGWVLFGDILGPLYFIFILSDRLGAPLWQMAAAFGVAAASLVFFPPLKSYIRPLLRPAAFVASSLILAVFLVGTYVDVLRRIEVNAFAADFIIQHSFFRSIREVPREFQLYLHAAALKDCVPYAWSYREMDFYILPPNIAANVLPNDWLERCGIRRSH